MEDKYLFQKKYDAENTKRFSLKLNKNTDRDILERLKEVTSMQGYIKELIRKDIKDKSEPRDDTIVIVEKSKTGWKAVCKETGMTVTAGSYDTILYKIKEEMGDGDFTIITEELKGSGIV